MNHESLVGAAARLVRRRWYLFVLAPILGALLVIPLQRSSSYRAEQVIRVDELDNVGVILGAEDVPEVELDRLTQRAQIEFDRSDHDSDISASYVVNLTARSVTLSVVADSAERAEQHLDELGRTFRGLVVDPLIAQLDVGIANADETLEDLAESMEQARQTLAESGGDAATAAVIAGSLRDTNDQIIETSQRRTTLSGLRDFIDTDLVTFGSADTTAPSTGRTALAAGALAGIVIAAAVALAVVLLDRSVRRVIHLERCAPEATPLGAIARSTTTVPPAPRAALATFAASHAASRVVVVPAGEHEGAETFAAALADDGGPPAAAASGVETAIAEAQAGDVFVVTVPWGRVSEDRVSAVVSSLVRANRGPVAAVLTDVPPRELDWASSRRSILGPAVPIASDLAGTLPE